MTKRGTLWIPVDVHLLDPEWNRFGLGDAAILAYIRLLAWCKQKGTDGLIPFAVAPMILNGTASDLEAAGLIATDDDDHVIVLDWHKWHESVDELEKRRAAGRERQRRFRDRHHVLKNSERSKYEVLREEKRRESRVTSRVTPPVTDVTWDVTCPHGAPYAGRGCIECRTGRDIG